MANSYIIWGCAGHAKVLTSIITAQSGKILAFFDNRIVPSIIKEIPIYIGTNGFNHWCASIDTPAKITGLVAIGGDRGIDRIQIQHKFFEAGLDLSPLIHPHASVCPTANVGPGTQILAQAVVAADCMLGETCIINHKASVDHECMIGAGVHCAPGATICGCVTVADNVFIGAGAIVLPRIRIGNGAIIGAGAVVTKDVPENTIVAGNPARVLRTI